MNLKIHKHYEYLYVNSYHNVLDEKVMFCFQVFNFLVSKVILIHHFCIPL